MTEWSVGGSCWVRAEAINLSVQRNGGPNVTTIGETV